ncbi:DNA-formamidopyrimidine glycosylase [Candidatus Nomurabacteria bacterium]|nr:DNA-formamidopyrimidine glycosylase [Candidatus Nomurabacteria bacterium]
MPELPEVETLRRELAIIAGKRIKSTTVFSRQLENKKILGLDRRAKILIITLSDKRKLLIHLKMTGQLIFVPKKGQVILGGHPQENPFKYTRAIFEFTDKSKLYFNDLRKFGWIKLLNESETENILNKHGVEPLSRDFTLSHFQSLLKKYPNRKIKQFLLDQSLIAGLGNIYVDESCFSAKILPTRIVKSLTPVERKNLHSGIVKILKLSVSKKGTSAKNYVRSDGTKGGFVPYLKVYGRKGEGCKRCKKTAITKIKLAGRGTHFCKNCQK